MPIFEEDHLRRAFIGGRWVEPANGGIEHEIINPATGEVSGVLLFSDEVDVNLAAKAASDAFAAFSSTSLVERLKMLESVIGAYTERLQDMADAITLEMGAPMDAISRPLQAALGLWHLHTTLEVAKQYPFERAQGTSRIVKEPVGVCGLITPWNWPMNQVMCKVAPALIAGCAIVLKPSQNAPYSAIVLAEILEKAGVPPGVFNLVQGSGQRLGKAIASSPLIDMVSLTGSTSAGVEVAQAAATTIKRVTLELGGKSANIILDSENFQQAVTHGVLQMMANSGQTCTAPSRMLVPEHRLEEAEAIAAAACGQVVVGDPRDPSTTMGPMANHRQHQKVQEMIRVGIEEGAVLISGGPGNPSGLERGYYVKPTIFSRANNRMKIATEEIFGPVLVTIPYKDEADAIAIANDSPYGLSGYVYGDSIEQAERVARKLRTGMVHLNGAPVDIAAPFGGYKQSGNGREWGYAGIEEFLETKSMFGAAPGAIS
ncbi:aldehyde dehydrogenase family protein [Paraburkholderia sp. CNPSo 3281]|uniref:aldehyde dehydrogenase family protein n=1 Tax=Paraburkholderia sp. CNPSo 3281 TaxID=2940933 RepID=UPI0020B7475A|nr:aldehyde dehydrogenase family protein [Paraburkholderia sp. CNPSo 3281]MCP3717351.1 aldehyde dehydrogenase family protein [Paraburkholderia sp. CNPSo 3281]